MASDVLLGQVPDADGDPVEVWVNHDETVSLISLHREEAALTFAPGGLDAVRGLLDRAAMPGQRAEPVTSCVCGKQIEPCDCGETVCTGWGHVHRNATRHWCGLRKEDGQPKPAEVSGG